MLADPCMLDSATPGDVAVDGGAVDAPAEGRLPGECPW